MSYSEKFLDPRWQKKRLEILERDKWACVVTGRTDLSLHVHHCRYHGENPWDTPNDELETVSDCVHQIVSPFAKLIRQLMPGIVVHAKLIWDAQGDSMRDCDIRADANGKLTWPLDAGEGFTTVYVLCAVAAKMNVPPIQFEFPAGCPQRYLDMLAQFGWRGGQARTQVTQPGGF